MCRRASLPLGKLGPWVADVWIIRSDLLYQTHIFDGRISFLHWLFVTTKLTEFGRPITEIPVFYRMKNLTQEHLNLPVSRNAIYEKWIRANKVMNYWSVIVFNATIVIVMAVLGRSLASQFHPPGRECFMWRCEANSSRAYKHDWSKPVSWS